MREGGERIVVIRPEFAFGEKGYPKAGINPNECIYVDLRLVKCFPVCLLRSFLLMLSRCVSHYLPAFNTAVVQASVIVRGAYRVPTTNGDYEKVSGWIGGIIVLAADVLHFGDEGLENVPFSDHEGGPRRNTPIFFHPP